MGRKIQNTGIFSKPQINGLSFHQMEIYVTDISHSSRYEIATILFVRLKLICNLFAIFCVYNGIKDFERRNGRCKIYITIVNSNAALMKIKIKKWESNNNK